ncbi:uncharacterized protein LOC116924541 isoform X2 [Daphnia magna]|uniref:uncharacterized protein LOC116924541 isoform X2 n=1 Tax=Daphnia magna TaxID=35525 RepID=UPI001E1BAA35|nr:uncharacterized protein LOC116924541 isoform X2 [Daphnia magna]
MLFEQEENDLQVNDVVMQEPAPSPIDSDYFSETDEDSPVDGQEENNPSDPVVCSVSDDWIELDLSMDSLRSLGFLSDIDFQAVLESFAEFTSHQLRLGVSSPREMEGFAKKSFCISFMASHRIHQASSATTSHSGSGTAKPLSRQ